MESLKPYFEPLERLLEKGGTRKDIACILISAAALLVSFFAPGALPIDLAWVAVLLCGVPIAIEAFIALVTEFDVKADVLVTIALIAALAVGQYFAAGEVAVIMQLGGLLEELTVARATRHPKAGGAYAAHGSRGGQRRRRARNRSRRCAAERARARATRRNGTG